MLKNGNLEKNWAGDHLCYVYDPSGTHTTRDIGNIFVPEGFSFYFVHVPGTYDQPEGRDAWKQNDARRVHEGDKGYMYFTFHRGHWAGLRQKVEGVEPGQRLRFTAWGHGWSNGLSEEDGGKPDNAMWSDGAGFEIVAWQEGTFELNGDPWNDAKPNMTFRIGIDPTGGDNPLADTVIWCEGLHIYNGFAQQLAVEAVAANSTVTVFVENKTLWGLKHSDTYWDDMKLSVIDGPVDPPDPPDPPITTDANKLGLHILRNNANLADMIQRDLSVVKFVGDWGMAPNVSENTLVIGAKAGDYDAQSQYTAGETPREAAERFVTDMLPAYDANSSIVYWEGHNEPVWNTEEEMAWYAHFEIERMELMEELGLKCIIGNFATGSPPLELWPAFLPAIEAGFQYEAILGLHEYSCPWMWWMTGGYQIDPDEDQGDEGWTTLRYRKVYRQYLLPAGLAHFPLVITETGIDGMVNPKPDGAPSGAWKQLDEYWAEHDDRPDTEQYYFDQLRWYEGELQKDAYVVGSTIFTWGNWSGGWEEFDISGTQVATLLEEHAIAHPAEKFEHPGADTPPEPPDPPVCECRGKPREQYERTVVVLSPGTTMTFLVEMLESANWEKYRFTITGSADDAGIGDLDARRVIAVNPAVWPDVLDEQWYTTNYPGVEYHEVVGLAAEVGEGIEEILSGEPEGMEKFLLNQRDPRWADAPFGER